jgi:hypothetical protein
VELYEAKDVGDAGVDEVVGGAYATRIRTPWLTMAPDKSIVRPPRTPEFGAPVNVMSLPSASMLSLSSSRMICGMDHGVGVVM